MPMDNLITVELTPSRMAKGNEALALLLSTGDDLAGCANIDELHQVGLEQFVDHFPVYAGRLYLLNPETNVLDLISWHGLDPSGLEHIYLNQGFAGKAMALRRLIAQYVTELPDQERAALLKSKGFEIVVCLPILRRDRALGVINLTCTTRSSFNAEDLNLMILFSHRLARMINNFALLAKLREKTRELEEQHRALESFSHTAFHDLKSPTMGILGLTHRLQNKFGAALGEKGNEYCRLIVKAAERVEALVRELNQYMKAKAAPWDWDWIETAELFGDIADQCAPILEERELKLSLSGGLAGFYGNRLGIRRLLQNLVDNALKHGGPTMTSIEIQAEEKDGAPLIKVIDDGRSIDAGDFARILEPFQRVGASGETEGSGLGLAISRQIVQRHGGRLWLETPKGGGVAFCFTLGACRTEPGEKGPAEKP